MLYISKVNKSVLDEKFETWFLTKQRENLKKPEEYVPTPIRTLPLAISNLIGVEFIWNGYDTYIDVNKMCKSWIRVNTDGTIIGFTKKLAGNKDDPAYEFVVCNEDKSSECKAFIDEAIGSDVERQTIVYLDHDNANGREIVFDPKYFDEPIIYDVLVDKGTDILKEVLNSKHDKSMTFFLSRDILYTYQKEAAPYSKCTMKEYRIVKEILLDYFNKDKLPCNIDNILSETIKNHLNELEETECYDCVPVEIQCLVKFLKLDIESEKTEDPTVYLHRLCDGKITAVTSPTSVAFKITE